METLEESAKRSLYRVEEVCGVTGVKPYVLRFWETEFPEIAPSVTPSGQKFYEEKDIQTVQEIKKLLFDEKLSIEKARLKMMEQARDSRPRQEEGNRPGPAGTQGLSAENCQKIDQAKKRLEEMVAELELIQKRFH